MLMYYITFNSVTIKSSLTFHPYPHCKPPIIHIMASQLLCIAGSWNSQCRRKSTVSVTHKSERVMNSASARHRNFHHDQHSSRSHVKLVSSSPHLENEDHVKGKKNKFVQGRSEARERPRLGLWYLTSCISRILRKARAFYNEFCCDAIYDDGDDTIGMRGYNYEVMLVDPYFSIPVTPVTSHDNSIRY